ncbi:MAG: hypothetical protein M1826_000995 [Phylliscum demangeonii]|nr:MAG: hypothetical protein M1826_000995 [Phylliscum demangeonii]
MKFILCLIPVGIFIVRSNGLYIPRGHSEYMSRELARPNTPLMFADVACERTSWPSHIVQPCVQKHAVLTKRTTDEASANRQNDVDRDLASVDQKPKFKEPDNKKSIDDLLKDPKLHKIAQSSGYPVEELAKAKRRWLDAGNAVHAFKKELVEVEKVREITLEEKGQLQVLVKARSQQEMVFRRMSQGFPANQPVDLSKKSIDNLMKSAELREIAQSTGYPVEELAKAKRRWLDAINAARAFKQELVEAGKVRNVTPEEKAQLQALVKARSQQETVFRRMSQGIPANQRVPRRYQKSKDDLLEDPKLHEMAQSSGHPVEELAEAKRRWLDARNAVGAFKKELAEARKVRTVTPEEKGQLQALMEAATQQKIVFSRMSQGLPVDYRAPRPKKSIDDLLKDPKLRKMAQSSGYPVEELAKARRRELDALIAANAFKKELVEVEKVRKVTPEEKAQLQALVKARAQQDTVFRRMSQGLPVTQLIDLRKKNIDDLMESAELHEIAQSSGYPVEELAKAKRQSLDAHIAANAFKKELVEVEKVRKVTPEEKAQLQALVKARSQQETVFRRMSQGFPANQPVPLRKSIDDLLEDPKLHEMAQSSGYPVEELAIAKRRWLDAQNAANAFKKELVEVEKVRKVTPEEKAQLQALVKARSQQETVFHRMSQGFPANQRVPRRQKSKVDLLEDPKLHEMAQSSGYPVAELAEAKRRWLDARNAAKVFKKELAEAQKVREVTPEEKGQLQALGKVAFQQETVFRSMSARLPGNQPVSRRKSIDDLLEDSKLHEIAQSSGYPVEELAKAKRRWLDAGKAVREFKKELKEAEKVREVTPEEKGQLQALVKTATQHGTVFRKMSRELPVDNIDVAALRPDAKVDEIAMFDRVHLDALDALLNFQQKLSALQQSGGSISHAHEVHLEMLQDVYNLQRAWWEKVRPGLAVHGINHEGRLVTYTAQEIAGYNQLFLDASDKLRAFEKQMAVAQQAGHSPTPDVKAQHRALQDDLNKKKTMWFRARDGLPVNRVVPKRRGPKPAPSRETRRPGSQEQASPASPAKEDPSTTHPPLQMAGPRHLLAPFLFSASRLLQGLGRQWRAMPWTRYLADPRLNRANPAELLRAEHALP